MDGEYAHDADDLDRSSGPVTEYPDDVPITDVFRGWAARTPDAVAVQSGTDTVSYRELDRWSDRLAARLVDAGVTPATPVGLLGERCLEAPAAMLGVLKAGAVYIPLNPADPPDRLQLLIDALQVCHVVTLPGVAVPPQWLWTVAADDERHGGTEPDGPRPPVTVDGGAPAYLMFTSGSTGVPKSVAVAHRSIARLVINTDYVRITAQDRLSNTGHLAFDASVFEIWGALLNGARVVVVDPDVLLDPGRLHDLFHRAGVTVAWLSAGVFHQCVRGRPSMFAGLRCLIAGGDVLDPGLVRQVLASGAPGVFLNGYGPTENTTFSTTYRITEVPAGTSRIPIGRPIANSTCHIRTDDGRPAPVGVEGELWVGGDGVAIGYANQPVLTRERFVPDPNGRRSGAQLFRTGDRARWLPGGDIEFLGRRDRMVKLRGFRVELDEIEAVLVRAPGVRGAAVVLVGDNPDTRAVIGFYVDGEPGGDGHDQAPSAPDPPGAAPPAAPAPDSASPATVRQFLARHLPQAAVPARLVRLGRFPLTDTGKVDRAALAAQAEHRVAGPGATATPGGFRPPATPIEVGIAGLWAELLDADAVGLDDSFFELGGNSLLAARVFARLQPLFGIGPAQGRFLTARLLADPSLQAAAAAVAEARSALLHHTDLPHADARRVDAAAPGRRDGVAGADSAGQPAAADGGTPGAAARAARPWAADLATPGGLPSASSSSVPSTEGRRRIPRQPPAAGQHPRERLTAGVFLTGAAGFLGSYLLRQLIDTTDARIHCLVRAGDEEHAWNRLLAEQARFQLGPLPRTRVAPIAGDLALPRFGLTPAAFEHLAGQLGLIMHAGACVNFTYPYQHLAPTTVGGTRSVIQLATAGGRLPIHFVSTIAVLAGFGAAGVTEVSEDTPLAFLDELFMGYTETKWVAEHLLGQASQAGLPVAIHRPYEIAGDLRHGTWNLNSATCALIRLIADAGIAPDVDLPLDLLPVDVLAAQLVHIALTRTRDSRTYHLANPEPGHLADLVSVLRTHGYPVRTLPFADWTAQAVEFVCQHPEHPFTPFVPMWIDRSPRSGLVLKEMYFNDHFPRFGRRNAEHALAGTGLRPPPVDRSLLEHYVRSFRAVGYLPPPADASTSGATARRER